MYQDGEDHAEAVKWYRKSAEQGYPDAQNSLGMMYELGIGVSRNYAEAAKWYRKAAKQGLAAAQFNLGHMYDYGKGVDRNPFIAREWYDKASKNGFNVEVAKIFDFRPR